MHFSRAEQASLPNNQFNHRGPAGHELAVDAQDARARVLVKPTTSVFTHPKVLAIEGEPARKAQREGMRGNDPESAIRAVSQFPDETTRQRSTKLDLWGQVLSTLNKSPEERWAYLIELQYHYWRPGQID